MVKFYYDAVLGLVHWNFEEPNLPNYSEDKSRWVTFNNGKEKMKLREYINLKARIIGRVSKANAPILRSIFIEAYNLEGIHGVDKIYSDTVKKLIISAKS